MSVVINGTSGISGVDGSAGTPAVQGTDTNTGILFPATDTVAIATNGSEQMRVDSSGNVGIGTASPASKLHVVGSFRQTGATAPFEWTVNAGANDYLKLNAVGYADNLIVANSAGNVGIGTSSGTRKLNVYGGASGTRTMTVTSNASEGLEVGVNASNIATVNSAAGGAIIFTQADTERMRIDSSGNVGIGTNSPSTYGKLVSLGTDNATLFAAVGATNMLRVQGYNSTYVGTVLEAVNLAQSANTPLFINGSTLKFGINGTTQTTIDSSGNVGIGTTSPGTKFTVLTGAAGNLAYFTDNINADFYIKTSSLLTTIGPNAGSTSMAFQTSGTERMRIDSNGNVGIGTASPGAILHTIKTSAGAATVGAFIQNSDTTVGTEVRLGFAANINTVSDNRYGWIGYVNTGGTNGGALTFATTPGGTAATERARIDSSGNLLVGTTSVPSTGAGTNSTIVSNKDYSGAFAQIVNSSSTSGTQFFVQFGRGSAECGKITSTGTNSTTYTTSSDYRLKEDIAPMTGALAKVVALKPVTYKWKSDGSESEGFIAHELAEVCPQAVVGEKDDVYEDGTIKPQGIDTSFLVATLTAAIQEQQAIIEQLKADVAALKGN
jgi:hypothetical protein